MEANIPQPWYAARPVPVFMAVFYCFVVLIQTGLWVFNEGLMQARVGDISFLALLNVCVVALLIAVGGLMLLARKKRSSWCFIVALVMGMAFSLSQMRSGSFMHVLALPMFKEYAVVFGIWVYSLQLRRGSYFDSGQTAE